MQEKKNVSYLQYSMKSELHVFAHVIRTRGPILFPRLAWKKNSRIYVKAKEKSCHPGFAWNCVKPCEKLWGKIQREKWKMYTGIDPILLFPNDSQWISNLRYKGYNQFPMLCILPFCIRGSLYQCFFAQHSLTKNYPTHVCIFLNQDIKRDMNIYRGDSGGECYRAGGTFREKKIKTADILGLSFSSERTKPCICVDKWINRDINTQRRDTNEIT